MLLFCLHSLRAGLGARERMDPTIFSGTPGPWTITVCRAGLPGDIKTLNPGAECDVNL